ncbi:unnamed protein product [Blepharisma stoltei]|uniref:Uncharacterized protein n=1 Tax=Blepharisma stoltei TaxID=1481888 RepID=A0AAU9K0K3_9CILI|nr:unnamed protein product [Blepharisma stoltei]
MAAKVTIEFPKNSEKKEKFFNKSVRRSISVSNTEPRSSKTMSISPANSEACYKDLKKPQLLLLSNKLSIRRKNSEKPPAKHSRVSPSPKFENIPRRQLSATRPRALLRNRSSNATSKSQTELITLEIPLHPDKDYWNERIYWKARKMKAQVLIINFEGVIGDYYRGSFWSLEPASFKLRDGLFQGMLKLSQKFRIVILSCYARNATCEMTELFQSKKIHIDAIYQKRHRESQPKFRHDYTAIFKDFEVSHEECMILAAIELDAGEIQNRSGSNVIFEDSASSLSKYLVKAAPIPSKEYQYTPITILVPHFRFSEKLGLSAIAEVIIDVRANKSMYKTSDNFFQDSLRVSIPIPIDPDLPCIAVDPNLVKAPEVYFYIFYSFPKSIPTLPPVSTRLTKRTKQ